MRRRLVLFGILIVMLGGLAVWEIATWKECRAAGHTRMYCARAVM